MGENEFDRLLTAIRCGDQDAGWELIEKYERHIRAVIYRRQNRRLQSKYDSTDFVQAVWASFFRNPSQLDGMTEPDQLIALLITIARNKVIDTTRRYQGSRRDVSREVTLCGGSTSAGNGSSSVTTPSHVAMAREQLERTLYRLTPDHQRIVQMRFTGATFAEIAEELQIHERTARRVIERVLQEQVQ
jgi:RNA polymerase sigma factor (sigma-70 family)